VYGVIEPSGKITRYVPPPSSKDIHAIEADGSEATEPRPPSPADPRGGCSSRAKARSP
jgi:hypothetical protein